MPPTPSPVPEDPTAEDAPLRVEGFTGTPEEIERQWFEQVFKGRGDTMPQLTLRSVLMGTVLGGVLALTNLYIGLKAGWAIGVAITACIVSFILSSFMVKVKIWKTPMGILETNCLQSTADSAGYATGATLVSAFSAYYMINQQALPIGLSLAWVFFIAVLGVTMAIPMKRQMINVEQLRFPTGIATAETLRALFSKGKSAVKSAHGLIWAAIPAAISQFWVDGLRFISPKLEPFGLGNLVERFDKVVFGPAWMGRTITFVWDPVFIGGGALMGIRPAASILLGGTLCWGVYVPILQSQGIITGSGYRAIISWTLWGGVSCMVVSGLLAFALNWRVMARAFSGLGGLFRKSKAAVDPMVAIETPMSWFFVGQIFSLIGLAWLAKVSLGLPVWETTLAVFLSFVLSLVACRVTGETDTTPIGALGKVTQITFGALNPRNMNVNLMSANITSGAAAASADLLTDLKSGYLLGANPRKQFLAQFFGIFTGTAVTVLAYRIMVPTASVLGSDKFPAPAAQTWRVVALALSNGFGALDKINLWSIVIGGAVGALLTLLPLWVPKHAKWIPSASGVGLSWTFHWYYGLLFFLGAFFAWIVEKKSPEKAALYNFPVAAGLIAGGSLMGVALIFWENIPIVYHQLRGG